MNNVICKYCHSDNVKKSKNGFIIESNKSIIGYQGFCDDCKRERILKVKQKNVNYHLSTNE